MFAKQFYKQHGLWLALLSSVFALHCSKPQSTPQSELAPEATSSRLQVGQKAPTGLVVGSDGEDFDIASAWSDQTAIVVFYRGHW